MDSYPLSHVVKQKHLPSVCGPKTYYVANFAVAMKLTLLLQCASQCISMAIKDDNVAYIKCLVAAAGIEILASEEPVSAVLFLHLRICKFSMCVQ